MRDYFLWMDEKHPARQDRVARGVALLDEHRPGWVHEVSPLKLSILSFRRCVLGQIYGDFEKGMRALPCSYGQSVRRYGFISDGDPVRLTWAWRRVIWSRRRAARKAARNRS